MPTNNDAKNERRDVRIVSGGGGDEKEDGLGLVECDGTMRTGSDKNW